MMPGCQGSNLGGILVEVPAVAAERDGLALHFVAQRAEQGLDPASSPGTRGSDAASSTQCDAASEAEIMHSYLRQPAICDAETQSACAQVLAIPLLAVKVTGRGAPVGEVVFLREDLCLLPQPAGARLLAIEWLRGHELDLHALRTTQYAVMWVRAASQARFLLHSTQSATKGALARACLYRRRLSGHDKTVRRDPTDWRRKLLALEEQGCSRVPVSKG